MPQPRSCHSASTASRVEWTTERTNGDAMAFYASLGARVQADKVAFRLDSDGLTAMAATRSTQGRPPPRS